MNLALRILGVAIFVSAVAGATFGAFQVYDQNPSYSSVKLTAPSDGPVTVLAGGSARVQLGLQNVGDTATNVTFTSATEGFSVTTQGGEVALSAGATQNARARLTAQAAATGTNEVTIRAVNAQGQRLGSVTLEVNVIEGKAAQLSLDPNLPAVVPGQNLTLQGKATNPVNTTVQLNFTVEGVEGTVEPASARVPANGSSTVRVTVPVPSGASGSVSVTLVGENEAGDTTRASAQVPVLASGEIAVAPVFKDLAVRPGNEYAVPILVVSNLDQAANVTASGEHVVSTNFTQVEPRDALGGFATFRVPQDASGTITETISVQVGEATRTVEVSVNTAPEGETATQGKQAKVDYVGRLLNGQVFDSSVPEVANGPFPKSGTFRLRPGLQPITVPLNPNRPGVISGFMDALVGMTEGESKTVVLPPSEAYGPVRTHQNLSATTEVPRTQEVPRKIGPLPKSRLPPSFDIENKTVGDVITYNTTAGDVPITFHFEVVEKKEKTVTLKRLAEEGETTTFYAPWENATKVTKVNETTIVYTTTPPEDIGNFTWDVNPRSHRAQWENATRVKSMNETTIVLISQPEEGTTYQASPRPRAPPKTYLIENVNQTTIHVSTPNDHPLAGKTLVFDLTLREVSQAEQRRRIPIGGGGR